MSVTKQKMPIWRKNLYVLWVSVFLAGIGFSEFNPFLPLYISTIGHYPVHLLNLYSGLVYSVTFIVSATTAPLWGKLADKLGRKPMILRAAAGMAIVIFLMGLVQNVWELIILRALQGLFAGLVSNSITLVATETPKNKSGKALGSLAASLTGGNLIGPLLGGSLASVFSYRTTFFITGFILATVFVIIFFFVHETDFQPVTEKKLNSARGVIHELKSPQIVFGLLVTTMIIQAVNYSINPIISLYVKQLMHNSSGVTFASGLVSALPGVATMLVASRFGELGDRIGTEKILVIGFVMAFIFLGLTAFVTNVWELGILRFCVGISDATMLPQVQTLLTKNTPAKITGRIFSWNQSFQYLGNIAGPILGSVISGGYGYASVFISSALLVLLNMILFRTNVVNSIKKAN